MFFDDRLATVLRHRAASEHAARTQFRQLLDLLGNRKYGRDESLIAAAWLRLAALAEMIPAAERAAMIREPGWRFRSTELAARLADDHPKVSAAALARADLRAEDWKELIPRLPVRARGFLRLRRDLPEDISALLEQLGVHDRGLPQPEVQLPPEAMSDEPPVAAEPAGAPAGDEGEQEEDILDLTETAEETEPVATAKPSGPKSEIAALVERISQFRKGHETPQVSRDRSPRLPLDEEPGIHRYAVTGFGFIADAAGRIEWAEEEVAPMVIGKRLLPPKKLGASNSRDPIIRAFSSCQPIERAEITLSGAPAIEGKWFIDAQPRFLGTSGRFHGYIGRFRRPAPVDPQLTPAAREADRIRQLLHELRTPVNALQGFAEVIQQQLFGPAPNEYRALAANIAGDAARILAGFDELERLAKLEGGAMSLPEGESDLGPLVERMVDQLQQVLSPRMAGFDLAPLPDDPSCIAMAEEDAEALIWRLLATLASGCGAGEALTISLSNRDGVVRLQCALPAQLVAEDDTFTAKAKSAANGLSAGLFGAGFSLRLARAEANAAGGDLVHENDRISLTIPHRPAQPASSRTDTAPESRKSGRKPARNGTDNSKAKA
jgi:hypothetical protein